MVRMTNMRSLFGEQSGKLGQSESKRCGESGAVYSQISSPLLLRLWILLRRRICLCSRPSLVWLLISFRSPRMEKCLQEKDLCQGTVTSDPNDISERYRSGGVTTGAHRHDPGWC
ncbi:unnamed protein product [Merluccius merluccius]